MVRLPSLPLAVVDMEAVSEADELNWTVELVAVPWPSDHCKSRLTMTSAFRSRSILISALLASWIVLVIAVIDAFGSFWIVTVAGVPVTRYVSDSLTFTVMEPAWVVELMLVGMVTVLVVPVGIWTVSAVSVPKSPDHEYSRLTAVSTARDRVTVAVMFWPSVTSVWSRFDGYGEV